MAFKMPDRAVRSPTQNGKGDKNVSRLEIIHFIRTFLVKRERTPEPGALFNALFKNMGCKSVKGLAKTLRRNKISSFVESKIVKREDG